MKRLAIFGASGHGKVVAEIAEISGWSDIIFFDDDLSNNNVENWNIQGNLKEFLSQLHNYDGSIVAIGDNQKRAKIVHLILSNKSNNLISLIHPYAVVSKLSKIG